MPRHAFTLIELLVVITIIGLVSAAVIPAAFFAISEQRLVSSAQLLHGSLVGARDAAIAVNAPCGIRLVPSVTAPAMFDQVMPLITPPTYSEGLVTTAMAPTVPGPLTVEQSPITWVQSGSTWIAQPNSPTSWAFNIRLGDRLTIGTHAYSVCGPYPAPDADLFVSGNTLTRTLTAPDGVTQVTLPIEYLLLTNGRDDNQDGYVDNGWDGLDNDGANGIDDAAEWETETWTGPAVMNAPYLMTRRPAPGNSQSIVTLSVPVSLAASTLPVNPLSGCVDLMIQPTGVVDLSGPYAAPSAVGMGQAKTVFVLQDPDGNHRTITLWTRTGRMESD